MTVALTRRESGQADAYYQPFTFANMPYWQVVARTSADPSSLEPAVERVIRSVDKAAEVTNAKSVAQQLYESAGKSRFQTVLLVSFGALALLLAIIGIYGVTSYSVVQRTQEIGVRMALGAGGNDVMRLIAGQGGALALAGIGIGLVAARALTRFMTPMLFEVTPADPATFVTVALLLFAAALAACYVPARRATRVDPVTTLRHD
jgi:ABC-type antimicrobial peptide transport system permease subunit